MTKNRGRRAQEDEIPKSVLKMKQEKEKRERAEAEKREGKKVASSKKPEKE